MPGVIDAAVETYLFDLVMASLHKSGHGCGNCRTPHGVSALFCRNDPRRPGTAAPVVGFRPAGWLAGETKLGPQTGAQRGKEN